MTAWRVCLGKARCLLLLATVILWSTSEARADETVLIVTGGAPRHAREVAINAVSAAPDLAGSKIVASPFLTHEESVVAKCMADSKPWLCMSPALRGKNIQQLAVLSIDPQTNADGSPIIVITEQVVTAAQFAPAGDKRFCDHCTDDVLARLATELTRDLLREVATRSGHTVVAIRTVPRGAEIALDGKTIGISDQSVNTYPGSHSVQLTLDGYEVTTRTVAADEGKTAEVQVTLSKTKALGPQPARPPSSDVVSGPTGFAALPRWVAWTGLGVGALVAGTGIVLQSSKDSPPKGQAQPKRLVSTPGVALIASGGAIAIASTILWIHIAHHEPSPAMPQVALAPNGGIVEWTGRF